MVETAEQTNFETERTLLQQLRRFLETPETFQKRRVLLVILDCLLQNMLRAQDEPGDYMSVVLEKFPNWSPSVESLRWRGVGCFLALHELRDRVSRNSPFELQQPTCNDLDQWMSSILIHRRDENRLLQTAMLLDVGGEA